MKLKIILAIMIVLAGCQKGQDGYASENDHALFGQFEKSDAAIGIYLDKLNNSKTSHQEKAQILCEDYPAEYQNNYMPALLKSENNHYTEDKLLNDLKSALDFYKAKENIICKKIVTRGRV